MIGLSSWIITDGNYEHFKCGQRVSFSLAFYPANSPLDIPRDWFSVDPPEVDRTSWGNRSLLFRDPDGNLVNFFTPISAESIKKFDKRPKR
jgi:hypothetical protein